MHQRHAPTPFGDRWVDHGPGRLRFQQPGGQFAPGLGLQPGRQVDAVAGRWGRGLAIVERAIDPGIALPLLRGPEGEHRQVMEQYQVFSQLLLDAGLRIRELSLNERGSWSVVVNNGMVINIGREQVLPRLQRFVGFYDRYIDTQAETPEAIDLRYRNGIAVAAKTAHEVAER